MDDKGTDDGELNWLGSMAEGDQMLKVALRTSLSGTFLQTLPDLVTPLKGTLYLRAAVHRRGQRPPKGSGTEKTVEAT